MLGSCLAAALLWCNATLLWCNALWHVLGSCTVHDVMPYIMLLAAAAMFDVLMSRAAVDVSGQLTTAHARLTPLQLLPTA